jgi:hypothetical protein
MSTQNTKMKKALRDSPTVKSLEMAKVTEQFHPGDNVDPIQHYPVDKTGAIDFKNFAQAERRAIARYPGSAAK